MSATVAALYQRANHLEQTLQEINRDRAWLQGSPREAERAEALDAAHLAAAEDYFDALAEIAGAEYAERRY